MKIIIDSNILISALIKDSTTRAIIVKSGWAFYYPEISFHEIRKYKELVLTKSGMTEQEYRKLVTVLLQYIQLLPLEAFQEHIPAAANELAHVDPGDVVFLAAAVSVGGVVWSDDAHFDRQHLVKNLKTGDVVRLYLK
jgi:predicted nucleic acid-binding protein